MSLLKALEKRKRNSLGLFAFLNLNERNRTS